MFSSPYTRLLGYALIVTLLLAFSCKRPSKNISENLISIEERGVLFQKNLPTRVIDSFILMYQAEYQIPAVSLAIIKEGKIMYVKNYGVVSSISQEPITQESVFEAASITKPVFAYVVCRLAQKGVIDLDVSLHERFPFPELEKYPCYKDMTARDVLTHVSGLPNWGTDMIGCPGEKYGYSGQGFEYLTKALAKSFTEVMDQRILAYLEEEVINPFEMSNTYFVESPMLKKLCVDGHLNNVPTDQIFPTSPEMAFGMHCNSKDIAKFAIMLLNRVGLNEDMAKNMFTIQTVVSDAEKEFDSPYDQGYGLGLYIRNSPKGKVFGHSGSNYDFKCLFEVYEDLKMGYVIMTNSDTGDKLINQMAKFLIEG